LVGISVDSEGSLDAVEYFLEENGVTYDILLDPDMVSTDVFAAIGLPATFLIDQEGIIRFKKLGPILEGDPDFLEALEHALD
ncbi:MAG TPA: TlpA family protein disulfide reductase, partial [Gemmatimonadetes bacterium]|nr:TlpA family protein disulfide reductase [Gemmatimonadota bacterium]